MKALFILLATALLATQAQAKNGLSNGLKNRVIDTVYNQCEAENVLSVNFEEIKVRREKIDQGSFDYYYSIVLNLEMYTNDKIVINKQVQVNAAEYDISNPLFDRYEIFSVKSADIGFCK